MSDERLNQEHNVKKHRPFKGLLGAVGISGVLGVAPVWAQPPATQIFCQAYPQAPACASGVTGCELCHASAPALNLLGEQLSVALAPGQARPLPAGVFSAQLEPALASVAPLDADADSFSNVQEWLAGSVASDASSVPQDLECDPGARFARYNVCGPDDAYVYKKLLLDFCGRSPSYGEARAFEAQQDTRQALSDALDRCLESDFWMGRDGQVWSLANDKIAPLGVLKTGEGADPDALVTFADYDDDYNFFVHAHTQGRDVRDVLVGQYFVAREDRPGQGPVYQPYDKTALEDLRDRGFEQAQFVERSRRAGMLTHRWFLVSTIMFSSLPRTTAAQAYRAYLGLDISKLEGLDPVDDEPADYDSKGVDAPDCAVCHSTLDPLTYPFSRYDGLGGGSGGFRGTAQYAPERLDYFEQVDGPWITQTPEAGAIFGQEVQDLIQWAQVAANSEAFAKKIVTDYWTLIFAQPPTPAQQPEVVKLTQDLMGKHAYSVQAMLHDLVFTEAYRVP